MIPSGTKLLIFIIMTLVILWVSRTSLRNPRSHGFYRFLAWETILVQFLVNVDYWFLNPFDLNQILSWIFLIISLVLITSAVRLFRKIGELDSERDDETLVGIEKTSKLVTSGVYRYIRHPFYSSLLFLAWGIFLKNINPLSIFYVAMTTGFLVITAKIEEVENIQFFGEQYQDYMKHTKMFIPYTF